MEIIFMKSFKYRGFVVEFFIVIVIKMFFYMHTKHFLLNKC